MRIDAIDVYLVRNDLYFPWTTAYGSDSFNDSILVKMTSGSYVGWSESSPFPTPTFSPEYAEGAIEVIRRFLIPCVLHKEFDDAESFNNAMSACKGNPFAKAALEIAWWTLQAKITGTPLYQLLGGSYKEITVGQAVGIQPSLDMLVEKVGKRIEEGSPRVKLKMCHGWDTNMLDAVRSTFPNHPLHVDCNSSYSIEEVDFFKKLDKYHLEMIEQPFYHQDLADSARLQGMIETPLCLDESITSPLAARQAIEMKACGYINIKPARVGGLWNCVQIDRMCKDAGVGTWIGGMLENDVGRGILRDLCSLGSVAYPSDVNPGTEKLVKVFVNRPLKYEKPYTFHPAATPDELIEPDETLLKDVTIAHHHFE